MINLGMVRPGTTIYVPWDTFAGATGASITSTGLAATDVEIYKDGSITQRASDSGYTLLDTDGIDLDGVTGIQGISIDLADNATAGFYAAGSKYWVVISSVTIDAQTVNFIAAYFTIGYPDAVINTTIATLSSQTSFTLTAGPAEDDALNGQWVVIHDVASAVQLGKAIVLDYTGSTKTVTLAAGTTFTAAATDNISIMGPSPLQPTTMGRTLDVSTGGESGVDWANVGSATTTVNLSGTTIATTQQVDVNTIKTNPVVNGGTITFPSGATLASTTNITAGTITTATNVTTVNGLAANVITATSINADAFTAAKFAADVTTELQSGLATAAALATVDTVVDGIATTLGTPSDLGGGATIAANLLDIDSTAVTLTAQAEENLEFFFNNGAADTTVVVDDAGSGSGATAAEVADAVWDEATAGHTTSGTFGEQVKTDIDAILVDTGTTLDTAIADLPTNAELATALGTADDAVLTAIGDLPTNAELATALGTADDAVLTAIDALPTANENADALLDRADGVEAGLTPRNAMRLQSAAAAGKVSGAATTEVTLRNAIADSKNRIIATVDADGNRSAITVDLT